MHLGGYAGLPTFSRANGLQQYFFVNGRPVRDKQLTGALRAAYADVMKRDRHPVAVLFIDLDPSQVDVNVHPTKAEVRFRDPGLVRGLIVGAVREALTGGGAPRASTTGASATIAAFRPAGMTRPQRPATVWRSSGGAAPAPGFAEAAQAAFEAFAPSAAATAAAPDPALVARPLGAARAQIHETYIVAQTEDGLVIVDQHAAHERLVYERLKNARAENGVSRQILLIPEIVDLPADDAERIAERAEELADRRPRGRAVRAGGDRGARDAGDAWPHRRRRACPRPRRRDGRMGAERQRRKPARPGGLDHGLPRVGPGRAHPEAGGNGRFAAGNGGDAQFQRVQPRAADLYRTEARRHRTAVRPALELASLPA